VADPYFFGYAGDPTFAGDPYWVDPGQYDPSYPSDDTSTEGSDDTASEGSSGDDSSGGAGRARA